MCGLPAQPSGQAVFAELLSTFGAPEPHSGTHFLVYLIDWGLCAEKSSLKISSYQGGCELGARMGWQCLGFPTKLHLTEGSPEGKTWDY